MLKDKFNNYPKTTKYYSKNNSSHHNPPKTVTNETIHLSAPGYCGSGKEIAVGALNGVGGYGCSWSSSISSENGLHLNFHMRWFRSDNPGNRGYGFQLRCLSE